MTDYRSRFEERVVKQMDENKLKFTYEKESINYYLQIPRAYCEDCDSKMVVTERWYTPDFFMEGGVILEAKGKFGAPERKKMLAVKEAHPELDIRMVFMRDNKIHRRSTTRYTEWAEKHGYPSCVGALPKEWIKEFKDGKSSE
jgi:hypothetical protein